MPCAPHRDFAGVADPKNCSWLPSSVLSFLILGKAWRNKEAWGKNIKQDPQASKNVLEWRFMTQAMAQAEAWGGRSEPDFNFPSFLLYFLLRIAIWGKSLQYSASSSSGIPSWACLTCCSSAAGHGTARHGARSAAPREGVSSSRGAGAGLVPWGRCPAPGQEGTHQERGVCCSQLSSQVFLLSSVFLLLLHFLCLPLFAPNFSSSELFKTEFQGVCTISFN